MSGQDDRENLRQGGDARPLPRAGDADDLLTCGAHLP
jgi:hypothetical protein